MSFVLDASVALSWCFEDEFEPSAERALEQHRLTPAYAPCVLFELELFNGLLSAIRSSRLSAEKLPALMRTMNRLEVCFAGEELDLGALTMLAQRQGLSMYDAFYLGLAQRYGLPLATLDRQLAAAAEEEGVELLG